MAVTNIIIPWHHMRQAKQNFVCSTEEFVTLYQQMIMTREVGRGWAWKYMKSVQEMNRRENEATRLFNHFNDFA